MGDAKWTAPAPPSAPLLSFYTRAPEFPIELETLERAGLLRLKVLCALSASPRGSSSRELRHRVEALDAFQELFGGAGGDAMDTTSHYALRLAFCKSSDLIEWMVAMESKLFALRLHSLANQEAVAILAREGITYDTATSSSFTTSAERQWVAPPSSINDSSTTIKSECNLYKVPFHEASRLVKYRRVLMKKGVCFVPAHSMNYVVQHRFRVSLTQQLRILQRALPANPETRSFVDRLEPILERFIAQSRLQSNDSFLERREQLPQITAETVDSMAEKHFPLCMRHLHRKFRENHHLKYDGRVQLRMFLKGIGWSVHDTLLFFRNEFIRVIPPAKFDKEYAYHIRHSYGLEGARKDYAPLDCEQIIAHGSAPRQGQYHGCPFRHWDAAHLSAELRGVQGGGGLSASQALEISTQAASGRFQGACQRFFDATHRISYADATALAQQRRGSHHHQQQGGERKAAASSTVSHPNAWLEASLLSS